MCRKYTLEISDVLVDVGIFLWKSNSDAVGKLKYVVLIIVRKKPFIDDCESDVSFIYPNKINHIDRYNGWSVH